MQRGQTLALLGATGGASGWGGYLLERYLSSPYAARAQPVFSPYDELSGTCAGKTPLTLCACVAVIVFLFGILIGLCLAKGCGGVRVGVQGGRDGEIRALVELIRSETVDQDGGAPNRVLAARARARALPG